MLSIQIVVSRSQMVFFSACIRSTPDGIVSTMVTVHVVSELGATHVVSHGFVRESTRIRLSRLRPATNVYLNSCALNTCSIESSRNLLLYGSRLSSYFRIVAVVPGRV